MSQTLRPVVLVAVAFLTACPGTLPSDGADNRSGHDTWNGSEVRADLLLPEDSRVLPDGAPVPDSGSAETDLGEVGDLVQSADLLLDALPDTLLGPDADPSGDADSMADSATCEEPCDPSTIRCSPDQSAFQACQYQSASCYAWGESVPCSDGLSCSCGAGEVCVPRQGVCVCLPDCEDKECGGDGCGGSCGECTAEQQACVDGLCQCQPACAGLECGPDGCGGVCGSCGPMEYCDALGHCQCEPDCTGKKCGHDGCGGSCGDCLNGQFCNLSGDCEFIVTQCENGFCWVPPGEFFMGSPFGEPCRSDNEKRHPVVLTHGFLIKQTEVTQGEWKEVMGIDANPSINKACGLFCPVENVDWYSAALYCNVLSGLQGLELCYNLNEDPPVWHEFYECSGYRLPSEAEWEWAARAGATGTTYGQEIVDCNASSGPLDELSWYRGNSGLESHPVGQKLANLFGLKDMLGNVAEWVWDPYEPFGSAAIVDPVGPAFTSHRVQRNGSFNDYPKHCRLARRVSAPVSDATGQVGFRIVRTLGQ